MPPRVSTTKPCIGGGSLQDFEVTELRYEQPRRGNRKRDLSSIQSIDDLPPYIADVVRAVVAGVQTTREFAERQHISISNASERFRVARTLGWIKLVEGPSVPRPPFLHVLAR